MFQSTVIGYLGTDAEVKTVNGKEFVSFRVAHTDKWTDEAKQVHETTQWIDCVINGKSAVVDYLKKGVQVFVTGNANLRVYSSAKDRCMKAGITISVKTLELIGGKPEPVPAVLFRADDGTQVDVTKWYFAQSLVRDEKQSEYIALVSRQQQHFYADRQGFVYPFKEGQE